MKTVHLHVRHGGRTTTLVFARFPVRIGREEPSECRLAFPFVSRSHAVLVLRGSHLWLRDLGSKGGTFVHNGTVRIDPTKYVDLDRVGGEFQIGRLWLRAEIRDDGVKTPSDGTSAACDDDDPNGTQETRSLARDGNATRGYQGAGVDPRALEAQAIRADLADVLVRFRAARAELEACVRDTAHDPCSPVRIEAIEALGSLPPDDDESRRSTAPPPSAPQIHETEVAMRVLQEIAAYYVPYAPPLVDVATVTAFGERLERVFRLLVDSFAALRFVYRAEDDGSRPRPARGIDVGARLLDWTADGEALGAFEAEVVEMIRHHARLTEDVSAGIAKLIAELDPDRIERDGPRTWLRPLQYRRYWDMFRYRHGRLANDASLTSLFGARFRGVRRALGAVPSPRADDDRRHALTATGATPVAT